MTTVDVESNGRSRLPSSVFLSLDGQILVGTAAQHQAVFAPERYEPTPKRVLGEGELFLGDRLVPVSELAAAVLRRVYTEACRQQGETAPRKVRITHPADWDDSRKSVLKEAVEKAGMPTYELVAEPVAAAVRISLASDATGRDHRRLRLRWRNLRRGRAPAHDRMASRSPARRPDATRSAARTSTSASSTISARCSLTSTRRTGRSS